LKLFLRNRFPEVLVRLETYLVFGWTEEIAEEEWKEDSGMGSSQSEEWNQIGICGRASEAVKPPQRKLSEAVANPKRVRYKSKTER
jgi:hypothetical protein